MERVEDDLTPGQEWQQSLNATMNRLSTQYVNLLRAASSVAALEKTPQDPRGKGYFKIWRRGMLSSRLSDSIWMTL